MSDGIPSSAAALEAPTKNHHPEKRSRCQLIWFFLPVPNPLENLFSSCLEKPQMRMQVLLGLPYVVLRLGNTSEWLGGGLGAVASPNPGNSSLLQGKTSALGWHLLAGIYQPKKSLKHTKSLIYEQNTALHLRNSWVCSGWTVCDSPCGKCPGLIPAHACHWYSSDF